MSEEVKLNALLGAWMHPQELCRWGWTCPWGSLLYRGKMDLKRTSLWLGRYEERAMSGISENLPEMG